MCISHADNDDSILASRAVYRIAHILLQAMSTAGFDRERALHDDINSWRFLYEGDRRFEQLSECIKLNIASLPIMDLARYAWAISILGIAGE